MGITRTLSCSQDGVLPFLMGKFKILYMKKVFFVLLFCTLCMAGFVTYVLHKMYSDNDISIIIKESDNSYRLSASYARNQTRKIQSYLNAQLHSTMFRNAKIDAFVTLDDKTRFYVKTIPGRLLIKLNKKENDYESYFRIKQLGEGIKMKLAGN